MKMPPLLRAAAPLLLVGAAIGLGLFAWQRSHSPTAESITIAIPTQMSAGTVFVARDKGYFTRQKLTLTVQSFTLGKQALQSVLDDKADLALVADVPFMFARASGHQVAVVATVFASRQTMALLGRRDRGISAPGDVAGKTLGTVKGTNAEYFLDKLLAIHNISDASVKIIALDPAQFDDALRSGKVDALTAWNPLLNRMQAAYGSNATVLMEPDMFVYRFLLVGKKVFLDAHPERVQRVLAALNDAVASIQEQPADAQSLIARDIGLQAQQLGASFRASDYALSLDQSLLLSLDDQTRWAMKRGLIPAGKVPNYLDAIDARPLSLVQPDAVELIR
jgi:NitT/TauT family transport system substrate-binding protein